MKKAILILVIGLFWCNNVYAVSFFGVGDYKHPYDFEFNEMISCDKALVLINEEKKVAWWNHIFFPRVKIKEKKGYKVFSGIKSGFMYKGGSTTFKIDLSKGKGGIRLYVGNSAYAKGSSKEQCKIADQFTKDYYEEEKKEYYKKNKQEKKSESVETTTETNTSNNKSITEELKELKKLYDEGVLTEEQFEKAKNKLLN